MDFFHKLFVNAGSSQFWAGFFDDHLFHIIFTLVVLTKSSDIHDFSGVRSRIAHKRPWGSFNFKGSLPKMSQNRFKSLLRRESIRTIRVMSEPMVLTNIDTALI